MSKTIGKDNLGAPRENSFESSEKYQDWVFNEIMSRMGAFVYVTDMETDKILFMNSTMKEVFGIPHPEGQICWKVLQKDMKERCAFCPVHYLEVNDPQKCSSVWEENNTRTGRIYENFDSVMRWIDGRTVHFQHSVDVTNDRRLYVEANFDELTGTMNRRAGRQLLSLRIEECRRGEHGVTVCLLDINNLKRVNDTYGHIKGDTLLVEVTSVLKSSLDANDFLFRLSGDEFVVVCPGEERERIANLMRSVLVTLRKRMLFSNSGRGEEFSFGICAVSAGTEISLEEVLRIADENLYEQKRFFHRAKPLSQLPAECFNFDNNKLFDAIVESTDDYPFVCDMKTGVFRYPKSMVEEFGLPGEIVPNAAEVWGNFVHQSDKEAFRSANRLISEGIADSHLVEYRAKNRWGEWVWLRCRGHLERDEDGTPSIFAGIITNIGSKNKIDPWTGLFNKYQFEHHARQLIEYTDKQFALLALDIDSLQSINNLYDRNFGDEVIRMLAQKLQSLLPANAGLYRLDGDEFGILIREGESGLVSKFFSLVQKSCSTRQEFDGKKFFCTLSCGCAFRKAGDDAQSLTKHANFALERAKRCGKNRVEFFTEETVSFMERSLELTELLRESVERDFEGFEAYFQPVFLCDRSLNGAETLMRWKCEKYGSVPPSEFVGLLEQSGLILRAGRWIIEKSIEKCRELTEIRRDFLMSVNLSCLQLDDPGLLEFISQTLAKYDLDPSHVILELTESYLAENMEKFMGQLADFRKIGVRIAMDDFGTGYSSLAVLKQTPADIVKIDRAFVKDIREDAFDNSFIRLVVELCHTVGIEVCAEGVETEEEFECMRRMGVDYIQGFLLGRPLTGEQMSRVATEAPPRN